MGLSDISQAMGRSKSEIFRMLHVLERRHYIQRANDSDLYTLTNRLFLLGMERPPLKSLLEIALPEMHEISFEAQQSCHLVVPSEEFMVVIARVDPPGDFGLVVRIGHRRPILEGTSGLVLTAFQPEPVRRRWIEEYGAELTATSRGELEKDLENIADKGYAAKKSSVVSGIVDISVPVVSNDAAVATLAVPYLRRSGIRISERETADMLIKTAAAISSKLP